MLFQAGARWADQDSVADLGLEGDAGSCHWPSRFGAFAAASSRGAVLPGFSWYGYGSIPMKIPFLGGWTSINPSYFDVNKKGVQGFDTLPYGYGSKLGTPKLWMVNTKLDIHICGPINGLPFWPTSRCETFAMLDLGRSSRRAMSVSYLQGWPVQRLKSRYWRHRQCFRNSIKMMPIFSSYDIYII